MGNHRNPEEKPIKQCWLQITAGQGPNECKLAVGKVIPFLIQEAQIQGLQVKTIDTVAGVQPGTYNSVLLSLEGCNVENFTQRWGGTIQWICESPYRPQHKRKNWFVGIDILQPVDTSIQEFNIDDVVFETMRSSGPGGQHVNTTDSAVRATHMPTGIVIIAREERSQHMNKKLALAKLGNMLSRQHLNALKRQKSEQWEKHNQLKRGNALRTFIGPEFQEKYIK